MRPIFLAAALTGLAGCSSSKPAALAQSQTAPTAAPTQAKAGATELKWEVLGAFPHDRRAFTQGLLWADGKLYESTGLEGQSSLRRVDLQSGAVEKKLDLPDAIFAEGLALANGRFYQLSWQNKRAFVYDQNFKPLAQFSYSTEGWGLTFDGKSLIQSDGSDTLFWRDPKNFALQKKVQVTLDGLALRDLNELEWIDGKVWANVWQTDRIVVIEPNSGRVESVLDLTTLISPQERGGTENVLNGIAWDEESKRLFVTGKNWPKLFWLRVQP